MKKAPPRPTKSCPHRWCRPLHRALYVPLAVAGVILADIAQPVVLAAIGLVAVPLVIALNKPIGGVPALDGGAPVSTVLDVDRRWANAAAASDLLLVLYTCGGVYIDASRLGRPKAGITSLDGGRLALALLIVATILYANRYAHHRATKPRRPRRVRRAVGAWRVAEER